MPEMSTPNNNEILLSTQDIFQSKQDINVSAVSTEDILLEQTGDILESKTGYNSGGRNKRKLVEQEWESTSPPTPSPWRAPRSSRSIPWPSSQPTSECRRGGWSRSTDPHRADKLQNEHVRMKQSLEKLKLAIEITGGEEGDGRPGVDPHPGGAHDDGDARGHWGDGQPEVPSPEPAREVHERGRGRVRGGVRDGAQRDQGHGQHLHHRADGESRHRGGGVEHLPRILAKRGRKVRGVVRDGRPQLSMRNYISKLVRGDKGSAGPNEKQE